MKKALEYFIFTLFIIIISFFIYGSKYNFISKNKSSIIISKNSAIVASASNSVKNVESKNDTTKNDIYNKKLILNTKEDNELFNRIIDTVKNVYVEEVNDKKIFEGAVKGILSSLDPHSEYMNEVEFSEMQIQTKGEFGGLGIVVTKDGNFIKVVSPIDDTPASKVGIKTNDYISAINDESTFDMSLYEAVKRMRGNIGEKVKVTVLRVGENTPLEFSIKREKIKTNSVFGEIKNDDIIYLKISSFIETTFNDTLATINNLKISLNGKKISGFILDLRNNPGGLLDQAVKISELFLEKDKNIVSTKGRNNILFETYKSSVKMPVISDVPVVVLVNEGSASASEIVAGALQDHKKAIILGNKTFGKASVQQVMPLINGGAMKLTIARYYTPNNRSIQLEGIKPDIVVNQAEIKIEEDKFKFREKDLKGHLENIDIVKNEIEKEQKIKDKTAKNTKNLNDYQLIRAIDLVIAINLYKNNEVN